MTLCIEHPQRTQNCDIANPAVENAELSGNMFFYGLDLKHDRLFHVSSAVKHILGYTPQEVMQNGLAWFVQQIASDDLKCLDHISDQHPQSGIIPHIHYHFKTKQGACCELYEHRCLLHDSNGAPSFIIGRVEKA